MLESIEPWNHKGAHWRVFQQCHETYPRKRHGNHFADWDTLQHIDGNLRSYGYYTRSSKEISTTFLVPRYGESLGAARYKKHRLGTAAPDPFDSSLWWFAHRMHLCPCFVLGQHACRWAQALTVRVRHPYPCGRGDLLLVDPDNELTLVTLDFFPNKELEIYVLYNSFRDNKALWREIADLTQKHAHQQQLIRKVRNVGELKSLRADCGFFFCCIFNDETLAYLAHQTEQKKKTPGHPAPVLDWKIQPKCWHFYLHNKNIHES